MIADEKGARYKGKGNSEEKSRHWYEGSESKRS
jgi:hypothetical protein